jgi:hypothetical protein
MVIKRILPRLGAVALVAGFALAAPAAAQVPDQSGARGISTMSPGRTGAILGVVVGLIGAVSGGRAFAGRARRGAMVALVLGPIGLVIGGLVVAAADGGVGTGNGVAGGIVAIVVGLTGMALGGLALARSRQTG